MSVLIPLPARKFAVTVRWGGLFVGQYRDWIADQRRKAPTEPAGRAETAALLLQRAEAAAARIERGIQLLNDETCLESFRIANRAMAAQAKRRLGRLLKQSPETIRPEWRPFQLAFVLMNLPGIADPKDDDHEVVDLLFFATGGGKTEAYLGLAAFTLEVVLRRLRETVVGVVAGSESGADHPGLFSPRSTVCSDSAARARFRAIPAKTNWCNG